MAFRSPRELASLIDSPTSARSRSVRWIASSRRWRACRGEYGCEVVVADKEEGARVAARAWEPHPRQEEPLVRDSAVVVQVLCLLPVVRHANVGAQTQRPGDGAQLPRQRPQQRRLAR